MSYKDIKPEQAVSEWLKIYGGDNVSAADFLCDRHARIPDKVALFYEDVHGNSSKWTFSELKTLSAKMAWFLQSAGIRKGDGVAVLLPKTPEMVITALAVWRLGAVYVPLFTAFGPDAIDYRIQDKGTRMIVTNAEHRPKLGLTSAFKERHIDVLTVSDREGRGIEKGDYSFQSELDRAASFETPVPVSGDDPMILIYTSGTTGTPKGVEVPVKALASFESYMRYGLDMQDEDMYWNMADPGWAYGLYYNLIGPLLIGKSTLFYNGPFTPAETYRILRKYRVSNFASAPTAYRALKAAGTDMARKNPCFVRAASSAGEPMNPEVIEWFRDMWNVSIHDHFGQTELGMAANNHHSPLMKQKLKLGSMGHSMPGFTMTVVDDEGRVLEPGKDGNFAVDVEKSPVFWFRGYRNDQERTNEKFTGNGRYYLAGDTVRIDEDGYFFFSGRSDDIILSAGYRIGPFEVESALMKHEAVAEVAVIGVPDTIKGEIVKAFVVLKAGISANEALGEELKQSVRTRLSAHEYPREIEFVKELPKTPSGKIRRFVLRG